MGNLGTGCIRTRGMVLDAETRRRGGRRGEDGRERQERGVSGASGASRRGIWRTGRKKAEPRSTAESGGAEEDAEKTVESVKSAESAEILGLRGAAFGEQGGRSPSCARIDRLKPAPPKAHPPEVESDGKPGDRLHQDSRDGS